MSASRPRVTVVVPVRNAGSWVPRLVAALEQQRLPREAFEVIVCDDGSTDGSTDRLATEDGWLTVSTAPPGSSFAARNRGANLARAEVIAFTDGDCRPEPQWLDAGLAALETADVVAGAVRFEVLDGVHSVWALIDVDLFLDQERAVRGGHAVTANLFIRRSLFERVGGFDGTREANEDYAFVERCVAAGARLAYSADAAVRHPTRGRARALLAKVWYLNFHTGRDAARDGRKPGVFRLRAWIPVAPVLRYRYRFRRSLGLDRARLAESELTASRRERILAVPVLYLLVPLLANIAELIGWTRGRALRARPVPAPD